MGYKHDDAYAGRIFRDARTDECTTPIARAIQCSIASTYLASGICVCDKALIWTTLCTPAP